MDIKMNPLTKKKLTKIASFTCVLHCIIAPFIVMAAPTLGHALENIWLELIALIVSLGFGIGIIYSGYCTHKKKHAAILFAIGAFFWLINLAIETITHHHIELELLAIGTIFILISYRINHTHDNECCTLKDH